MKDDDLKDLMELIRNLGLVLGILVSWLNSRKAMRHAKRALDGCTFPKCGHICLPRLPEPPVHVQGDRK